MAAKSLSLSRVLQPSLLILLTCLSLPIDGQTNQWAWIGGSSQIGSNGGQSGVYGTLGTPSAGNIPGGRIGAANWTDSSGRLWLMGGYGYDANGEFGYLNDLWEFNPSTREWTWMSGSDTVGGHGGQPGVYGTLGTAAVSNTPGSRNFAAAWTDSNGNLWLFGGWDYDVNSIAGELNDLWEFNPSTNQWAWMGGSSTVGPHDGQSGVYGTLGTPASGNTPGGLFAPSSWCDSNGNLWLFGGQGYDSNGNFNELNGLWEFDPSTTEWAWQGGSKTVDSNGDVPGVYGTLGATAAGNIPGNRSDATSWISDGLWLFGGNGYDANGNGGNLNDLWQFDPATGEWAWMSGSSTVGSNGAQPGVYGTLGVLTAGNTPGGRSSATGWTDFAGNLWLLGGFGADADGNGGYLNDLWLFNPASDDWAWMSGSSTVGSNGGQPGVYGVLGTASAGNTPGGRNGASGWTDSSGNLWLFGGYGYDAGGNLGYLNDLWKFLPSTATLSAAIPVFSPPAGNYSAAQRVTISDATAGATIYYTTDGTTPTTSSAVYSGAISVLSTETLKAIAAASGYANSAVATAVYSINIPNPAAATPTFSPTPGTYTSAQTVTISDATASATIYYTTNGTTPTASSAAYAGPIPVSATETILAFATASNYTNSAVATAAYTINIPIPTAATPTFSPPPGSYTSPQSVSISDSTTGAAIYYTTNGTAPTTSSALYTGPITVTATKTIQAIATANGDTNSTVAAAAYTIAPPAPAFTIDGTAVTLTPGASTGNTSTITITPIAGFTGAVGLSAAISAAPAGAQNTPTFSFGATSPVAISGADAAVATLTVSTTSESSATSAYPARPDGRRSVPAAIMACLLLFCIPARRRWRTMLFMIALFAVLASGAVACAPSITRNTIVGDPGTTPGTYTVTVTGTSGATAETGTVTVTVQ